MKILHIEAYYNSNIGYQITYLARYQKELGHEVYVITSNKLFPGGKGWEYTFGPRITPVCCRLENKVITYRLHSVEIKLLVLLKGLSKLISDLKPDVIHVHQIFWNPIAIQVAMLKRRHKFKLIYDSHVSYLNTRLHGSLIKEIISLTCNLFLFPIIKREADYITAVGEDERETISQELRIPPEKIPIILLGTDTNFFKYDFNYRSDIRKKLGIKEEELVVLTVGKITKDKDYPTLIEAISKVSIKINNIKLIFIGGGHPDYINRLRTMARKYKLENKTIFLGAVDHKELPRYYSAVDVGVWTGGPTVCMLEAISCSLPIIIADNTSIGFKFNGLRLISKGNGFIFKRGDVEALSENIYMILANEDLRNKMRNIAREVAAERLDWKMLSNEYIKLYKRAINGLRIDYEKYR